MFEDCKVIIGVYIRRKIALHIKEHTLANTQHRPIKHFKKHLKSTKNMERIINSKRELVSVLTCYEKEENATPVKKT